MQLVLMNDSFESITIFDISLLKTIKVFERSSFGIYSSDYYGLSYLEQQEIIKKELNQLLELSFSYGIIQDITIGMPRAMISVLLSAFKGIDDKCDNDSIFSVEEKIRDIIEELKKDLHAFISQAKRDSNSWESNETRVFFTEKYVKDFIIKVESIGATMG